MIYYDETDDKWNQWFAGLTDGDGCFYISKKENTVSYEITTHVHDLSVLVNIKNKLKAGSVKLRSGNQSARFRVKDKKVILAILQRVNGKLFHPARIEQFKQACQIVQFEPVETPKQLNPTDGYLSGLIDSDGSLVISVSKSSVQNSQLSKGEGQIMRLTHSRGFNQISLKVTSIHKSLLLRVQESYHFGLLYTEKANPRNRAPNPKYHWTIKSYEDFQKLYAYLKLHPLKSRPKMHRVRLSLRYFHYKKLKYHLQSPDSVEFGIWTKFCRQWFKHAF